MARHQTLTDEDILDRARPLFTACGQHAKTRQLSAAIGLTWGAVARRFGSKHALFLRAMQAASPPDTEAGPDLEAWLLDLGRRLDAQWPMQLQLSLSSASSAPSWEACVASLTATLQAQAERGALRADLPPQALAALVLAALTGDAARRFIGRRQGVETDEGLVETLLYLLAPERAGHPSHP